ncbi:MAG: threonylcarbamoyl-AMP synthase [Bradymonadales bacterium]|nr:threonylcarbamoyl-AMP synthase [Bradymonadales bacterium]
MTECIDLDRNHPRPDLIWRVSSAIREGKLVGCPTDTTYGIFIAMDQREATDRLQRLRVDMAGSASVAAALRDKPLSMIFSDLAMLGEHVIMSKMAYDLVKRLLPGPYTIILPAGRNIPKKLQTRRRHVGARIPDDPLVQAVVHSLGNPVMSASAKQRDGTLIGDADTLYDAWCNQLDIVIDAGPFFPEPSTVLQVDDNEVLVIREGKGQIPD